MDSHARRDAGGMPHVQAVSRGRACGHEHVKKLTTLASLRLVSTNIGAVYFLRLGAFHVKGNQWNSGLLDKAA
jgi:hypothetical protein